MKVGYFSFLQCRLVSRGIGKYFIILCLFLFALASSQTHAFKPNNEGHEGLTTQSLQGISRTIDSETLNFTERAIEEVARANNRVDLNQFNAALHFDDESLDTASTLLVTLKEQTITSLLGESASGKAARQSLGRALHTIQDFFSHSTAVESGFGIPDFGQTVLGRLPLTTPTCTGTILNPGTTPIPGAGLTSGYFQIPLCVPPDGKCRHGVDFVCPAGINKDTPARPNYTAAFANALQATTNYTNAILDDPRIAGNAKAIKRLMDIRPTLGVVIDDTGSMGPIISAVKSNVASIVASVKDTEDEPDQYLLQTFNDPTVGSPLTFSESAPYLAAVNAVSPNGGGDCPELAWSGTFLAVNKALTDSKLYLFTDASPKDAGLAGNVAALAKKKRTKVYPLLFGSCSPYHQTFFDVAQSTGGQVFILGFNEANSIFNLIAPLIKNNVQPILAIRTTLTGDTVLYDIPIDETLTQVTFSVSMPDSKGTISLMRPDNSIVQAGDADATITDLFRGRIYTIEPPATGTWRLQVSGTGGLSVSVNGVTPLFLNTFEFAKLSGRPVHQALFPIDGSPVVNQPATAMAQLVGPYTSASFELRRVSGEVLMPLMMNQNNPDAGADKFVGNLTPPTEPFIAYVTGTTAGGHTYQRLLPGEILAATIEVRAPDGIGSVQAGTTTELPFEVTNFGEAATFDYVATDEMNFISGGNTGQLTLNTGETATIVVKVSPPEDTPEFTEFTVSLTVGQPGNRTATNSATLTLLTSPANSLPLCNAATPDTAILWSPDHKLVPITILGVTDPDGDTISIVIDGITQDEAVDAAGSGNTAPDGQGVGTSIASVRAERTGSGDGRVYAIGFSANDGRGGQCSGVVKVSVPHDKNSEAVDSGQLYDSTIIPPGFK